MTAPITCEESAPLIGITFEKKNDIDASKDVTEKRILPSGVLPRGEVNDVPRQARSGVLPGGGLANDVLPGGGIATKDKKPVHPDINNDRRVTSHSSQGDVKGNLKQVLPVGTLHSNPILKTAELLDGQLPIDAASVARRENKTAPKKTCSERKPRRSKKRSWMERILEDSVEHIYDFDPQDLAPIPNPTPGPACVEGRLIECEEISRGTVAVGRTAVQSWDHNLLETIPQFPKVESFDIDNSVSMLPPLQYPDLNEIPPLDAIALPGVDNKYPWMCKEEQDIKQNLDMTIRIMSGGPTPHMVAVGIGGRDEINVKADRKTQTANRIRRLDILSRTGMVKGGLSTQEEEEKKRLLKLEKNRRAAQISREKKKRYILNLERRAAVMAKHLAALECENNQLRALLLNLSKRSNAKRSLPARSKDDNSTKSNSVISSPARIIPKVEPADY